MIWLNHHGPKHPYGSEVASNISIGGRSYNVWFGGRAGSHDWYTVTYAMTSRARSVSNLDLRPLVADAVSRGYISTSWYLINVEAGFEVWQGGAGLATKSFSVNVGGGHLACHAAMSQRHPADHSTTDVLVRTADHAEVTTIVHFRTGNRIRKLRASAHGRASIPYAVGAALAGIRVRVSVAVRRGSRSGRCSTWFTPRRA